MFLCFVYNGNMTKKQTKYRRPVEGRSQTCKGDQDVELEVHPHSSMWRRLTTGRKIEVRPDVYREDSDLVIDIAAAERAGHGALHGSVSLELITPLADLEAS